MANWVAEETRQVMEIIKEIDRFTVTRRRTPTAACLTIDLSHAEPLRDNLMEGSLFIRQLYQALSFNEHQLFEWRLEHKLVQCLALNHYCPGSVPVTRGLALQAQLYGREALRQKLHEEFPGGFWIKYALCCSSGDHGMSDMSEQALEQVESGDLLLEDSARIFDETWIVQERIPIAVEYRVHSLEDQVVDDLTFWRYDYGDPPRDVARPVNAYVQSILNQLPAAVVGNSLCGWDVALTDQGTFIVVEVNFSGFHPVYERGFHCSGFFQDRDWGPKTIAHLIRFIESMDGVTIVINSDVGMESEDSRFYSEIEDWKQQLAADSD